MTTNLFQLDSCKCYFFSVLLLLTSLCSYSLRSIIWNEILGVRASFRVVTVGHYRVFRWMNGAFVHWLLFSTFWDKKKNLFLKTENVNRIFYYTKLVLNIVTFLWKFCFSDVYLKNVKDLVMSFGFLVRRSKLTSNDFFVVCEKKKTNKDWSYFSIIWDGYSSKSNFLSVDPKKPGVTNFPSLKKNFH